MTVTGEQSRLSWLNWRVWFLGYGLGGCAGLTMFAGAWSLFVDDQPKAGWIAIAVSLAHATLLCLLWSRRFQTPARTAVRTAFLFGASGIALVALLLNASQSQVPGLSALFTLALMSLIGAFTIPLQYPATMNAVAITEPTGD